MAAMRYSIVIPAWNEAKTIRHAVEETRNAASGFGDAWEVIVVDDGSKDETAQIVGDIASSDNRIRLVRHGVNRGKGAAVQTGVLSAQGEWIVYLDADLSVHPSELSRLIAAMNDADIVMGSRRVVSADIAQPQPWHRDYAGRAFNIAMRTITGLPYRDTQCGFKAFHRRTIRLFEKMNSAGWAFDVELLIHAKRSGFRIVEVPVTWRHGRESRVKWTDAPKIIREVIAISKQS
jgi:glycosyltransferase involved in cell wall biosynthesis